MLVIEIKSINQSITE